MKPFDEVSETIRRKVLREKKVEKAHAIASEIKGKIAASGDINSAKNIFPLAKVASANDFTPSGTINGIGRDFAFSQAALESEVNSISNPVKSTRGSYLIKVTDRTAIDSTLYSIQKNSSWRLGPPASGCRPSISVPPPGPEPRWQAKTA